MLIQLFSFNSLAIAIQLSQHEHFLLIIKQSQTKYGDIYTRLKIQDHENTMTVIVQYILTVLDADVEISWRLL